MNKGCARHVEGSKIMKKMLLIVLSCLGTVAYAQNHLTVNGVTLGQEINSVFASLVKSYPNLTTWDSKSNAVYVKKPYLGNIQLQYAQFYSKGGNLSKCVFAEMLFEEDEGSGYYNRVANKYKQLVQQFSSKYGQPYISKGKGVYNEDYQECSWLVGSDRIIIRFEYMAGSFQIGGNASVLVQYYIGEGSYHGF